MSTTPLPMDGPKEPHPIRTKSDILQDYRETTSVLGDRCYRKKLLELEIENIYSKLYELNKEHMGLDQQVSPPVLETVSNPGQPA